MNLCLVVSNNNLKERGNTICILNLSLSLGSTKEILSLHCCSCINCISLYIGHQANVQNSHASFPFRSIRLLSAALISLYRRQVELWSGSIRDFYYRQVTWPETFYCLFAEVIQLLKGQSALSKFTLILRLHCGGVHNFHPSFPTNSENRTISQYPFKAVGVAVLF